jgi:hypothetical protein
VNLVVDSMAEDGDSDDRDGDNRHDDDGGNNERNACGFGECHNGNSYMPMNGWFHK